MLSFSDYHVGATDGPAYSSQNTHLAWSYWGCCCLFPHFKGVECRCGYIASFSCSAFLKEKFAFVSVKMMGVLFAPVDMGFWSPNSFSIRELLSLAFYSLKWNSIYVLNGSVLVRIRLHVSFSFCGWCGITTCKMESVSIFISESCMWIFYPSFCSFGVRVFQPPTGNSLAFRPRCQGYRTCVTCPDV